MQQLKAEVYHITYIVLFPCSHSDPLNPTAPQCNGVGRCECGECVCDRISNDTDLVFQGPYCQYNPLSCPVARDDNGEFKPCAGKSSDLIFKSH